MKDIDIKKDVKEDKPSDEVCIGNKGNCSGDQSCCKGYYCWGKRKSNKSMKCMRKCGRRRMRCDSNDACCSENCNLTKGKCQ